MNALPQPTPTAFEARLQRLEHLLGTLSAAMVAGEATELEQRSADVRHAVVDFSQTCSNEVRHADLDTQLRLQRVATALARQRENLLRRTVVVERNLQSLLPGRIAAASYGPASSSARARAAYGAVAR